MKNKEITMLELFKLIEDGEAPKKIKIYDEIYKLLDTKEDYINENDSTSLSTSLTRTLKYNYLPTMLQINVEIIPEENDEWEDIEEFEYKIEPTENPMEEHLRLLNTFNRLIKNQKYLKEKLEEK